MPFTNLISCLPRKYRGFSLGFFLPHVILYICNSTPIICFPLWRVSVWFADNFVNLPITSHLPPWKYKTDSRLSTCSYTQKYTVNGKKQLLKEENLLTTGWLGSWRDIFLGWQCWCVWFAFERVICESCPSKGGGKGVWRYWLHEKKEKKRDVSTLENTCGFMKLQVKSSKSINFKTWGERHRIVSGVGG